MTGIVGNFLESYGLRHDSRYSCLMRTYLNHDGHEEHAWI